MLLEALQISLSAGLLNTAADIVQCRAPAAPKIYVKPKAYPTRYNHRLSIDNLTKRGTDTISPYPHYARTHTGGITESRIELRTNMQFQHQTYPSLNVGCVYFDSIEVTLQLDPTIYVARDYQKRSCHYREILRHEKQHVNVDKEILNKYARKVGEALRLSVNDSLARGPYPLERLTAIQNDMQNYISSVIKTQQSLMQEDRFRRQQAVDSFEEYERIREKCE